MGDYTPRTHLRNSSGPQVVESYHTRDTSWSYGRHGKDDSRSHRRSRRSPVERRSKCCSEQSTRHRSNHATLSSEKPAFRLDVLSQPSSSIVLGMEVGITVLLSLQFAKPELVPPSLSCDTSRLLAVVSLMAEMKSTERKPMESGSIIGPRLADSLHQVPRQFEADFRHNHPCRLVLGYFSMSELIIRQAGSYRIRATVLQAPTLAPYGSSPSTVIATDSHVVKVDRRPSGYRSRLA